MGLLHNLCVTIIPPCLLPVLKGFQHIVFQTLFDTKFFKALKNQEGDEHVYHIKTVKKLHFNALPFRSRRGIKIHCSNIHKQHRILGRHEN